MHKTIAMQLHHVTTQVRDKDKYHWKHSALNNITFFFLHMPNLCSYLYGNQIENLPPGVFTKNTELTRL